MFSKALFKQSWKANRTMWFIISFAVCFMLACVMLISGKGSIGETITSVENTIVTQEIDASLKSRALNAYENQVDGMHYFDTRFAANIKLEKLLPDPMVAIEDAYNQAIQELTDYSNAKALAINPAYTPESDEAQEMLGSVMYAINPDNMFDEFYTSHGENVPEDYFDATVIQLNITNLSAYFESEARREFINKRAEKCAPIFIAGNVTMPENEGKLMAQLSKFNITPEVYAGFGYTYTKVKQVSEDSVNIYSARLQHELQNLDATAEDYEQKVKEIKLSLSGEISESFLTSLPEKVSSGLQEIGQLNLYGIVVGTIFYKLAGLLLPIIFMIMASNNLIAGQVDSGSMAYVLSTSTKRQTVVFTQAMFLILSLLSMFVATTVTGCVCLAIVDPKVVDLSYKQLILLNIGAFLVLFALSGLCFFTSCWFDRSKRSMAIGGGLSFFALVAAMLGLFGSPVLPSIVRLDALNYFNYATIISLFDAISILDGTGVFIWKMCILLVLGVVGYIAGSVRFVKKDLPL